MIHNILIAALALLLAGAIMGATIWGFVFAIKKIMGWK